MHTPDRAQETEWRMWLPFTCTQQAPNYGSTVLSIVLWLTCWAVPCNLALTPWSDDGATRKGGAATDMTRRTAFYMTPCSFLFRQGALTGRDASSACPRTGTKCAFHGRAPKGKVEYRKCTFVHSIAQPSRRVFASISMTSDGAGEPDNTQVRASPGSGENQGQGIHSISSDFTPLLRTDQKVVKKSHITCVSLSLVAC